LPVKVNVVLRTCDKVSLADNRIYPKKEVIERCLNSLVKSLDNHGNYSLHIIDDNSTNETKDIIQKIANKATFNFLPERDHKHLNNKQKSRYSVKVAYDYIDTLPEDELVYIVEDDYLHYLNSINVMVSTWEHFQNLFNQLNIGIFPQDFFELHYHEKNHHNNVYVRPCITLIGPDRYYRTTWFTHESFMVQKKIITKYKNDFNKLLLIGEIEGMWEGLSLSNVWEEKDFLMLMPMKTLALHISKKEDIPFYCDDLENLWEQNKL